MEAITIQHIKTNLPTLQVWADNRSIIDISNDLLQPIIPEFKKEFPDVNLTGCHDCISDMIIWAVIEYKKTLPKEEKKK